MNWKSRRSFAFLMIFDNWITEKSPEVSRSSLSEDAAGAGNAPDKNGKRQRVWKDLRLTILWRVPEAGNLVRLVRAQLRPKSVYFSAFFIFTQKFLFRNFISPLTQTVLTFHASVANGLRQAVCKTVAFALWKFESFPMHFNFGF